MADSEATECQITLILLTLVSTSALLISSPKHEPCRSAADATVAANAGIVHVPDTGKIVSTAYHRRDNAA